MTYIVRNGKIYDQNISEVEVDVEAEKYKLQAFTDALLVDERQNKEMKEKQAEIDLLKIDEEKKNILKNSLIYSGSGITHEMVKRQKDVVDTLMSLKIK